MKKPICPACGSDHLQSRGRHQHSGKRRYQCQSCYSFSSDDGPVYGAINKVGGVVRVTEEPPGVKPLRDTVRSLHAFMAKPGKKRLVITGAQNATAVHGPFLKSLLTFCRVNDAQLVVIPYRYRNPTSRWSERAQTDDWWDPALAPYLYDERVRLNENLELLGDIKTQPTASRPTGGFETITGPRSAIIAHPKLELVTIPTPAHRLPKIVTTTGVITERNYIESKAGKKAEFHHTFGAALVELDGKLFHLRQINALDDGSFQELDRNYNGDEVTPARLSLVMGDTHREFRDEAVDAATWAPGGIVDTLKPIEVVWHDTHDFYTGNHHHRNDPIIRHRIAASGRGDIRKELNDTFAYMASKARLYPEVKHVVVPSNHTDALSRWIKETHPLDDPMNAEFWAETMLMMLRLSVYGPSGVEQADPFAELGQEYMAARSGGSPGNLMFSRWSFLRRDQSHLIFNIEVGYHGDKGPNGGPGTVKAFGKIGAKTVTGHGHAPGIMDGAYRNGTNSRLRLSYNGGPSSWLHTDTLIYENGKRSLLNIIEGKWRL